MADTASLPGYEPLTSIEAITAGLASVGYISTTEISTALYIAHHLRKPILIEGPAGVGKSTVACALCAPHPDSAPATPGCYTSAAEPSPILAPTR